jgi:uncharacterized protein (DUF2267 family)
MRAPTSVGREGRTIGFAAFLGAVQDMGALPTVGEAERAARAALGELAGNLSWETAQNLANQLPKPLRKLVRERSFDSSMSRFAPRVFLQRMAAEIGASRAAEDARAVLRALDVILPETLREQLHAELASLWGPLTGRENPPPGGGGQVGGRPVAAPGQASTGTATGPLAVTGTGSPTR